MMWSSEKPISPALSRGEPGIRRIMMVQKKTRLFIAALYRIHHCNNNLSIYSTPTQTSSKPSTTSSRQRRIVWASPVQCSAVPDACSACSAHERVANPAQMHNLGEEPSRLKSLTRNHNNIIMNICILLTYPIKTSRHLLLHRRQNYIRGCSPLIVYYRTSSKTII